MSDDAQCYEVTDYTIAAVLFIQGARLVGVRRDPPTDRYRRGRTVFSFADGVHIQELHQQYLCGQLQVDPQQLVSKMKEYRQLIYDSEALGRIAPTQES
jgi:hypothetical protein